MTAISLLLSMSLIGARTSLSMGLVRVDYESIAKTDVYVMAKAAGCSQRTPFWRDTVMCLPSVLDAWKESFIWNETNYFSVTPVQMPV